MLTPDERRGALLVLGLFLLGGAWDLWAAWRPADTPVAPPSRAPAAAIGRAEEAEGGAEAGGGTAGGPSGSPRDTVRGTPVPDRVISLNRATAPELESLPGIGPVLAGRIIEHRLRYGPFRSVDELRAVRGVGPRVLERLRPRLSAAP